MSASTATPTWPASSCRSSGWSSAIVLLWDEWVGLERARRAGGDVRRSPASASPSASTACSPTARSRPTSRSSTCSRVFGSMAVQGPVMSWVADHRKHHAHTDQEGDPHSPHGHGAGFKGAITGSGTRTWAGCSTAPARRSTSATRRDLHEDRGMRFINKTFLLWVLLGLLIPAADRLRASTGTLEGALTGALWGGAVRIFLLHHVTWSINSVCHFFGSRRFDVEDHSTNVFWLAAVHVRRVLAPQPPRVPALGHARAEEVGGRPDRVRDPRHAAAQAGVERGRDLARAPGAEGSRSVAIGARGVGGASWLGRAGRDPARVVERQRATSRG